MLKPDLYEIIKQNKPAKIFVVDEMIKKEGHSVVRLPPYHCNLNPIENIWALMKRDVAANNTTFTLKLQISSDWHPMLQIEFPKKRFQRPSSMQRK